MRKSSFNTYYNRYDVTFRSAAIVSTWPSIVRSGSSVRDSRFTSCGCCNQRIDSWRKFSIPRHDRLSIDRSTWTVYGRFDKIGRCSACGLFSVGGGADFGDGLLWFVWESVMVVVYATNRSHPAIKVLFTRLILARVHLGANPWPLDPKVATHSTVPQIDLKTFGRTFELLHS